jgi:FXSXX-COOH protein
MHILEQHRAGSGAYGEIGGHAMQTTEDTSRTVPSKLANLRDVPLAELPAMNMATLDEALGRLIADPQAVAAPVAAFQSAI